MLVTENAMMALFSSVIKKLEREGVPYMVVGSLASIVYGEPRMTHDMDLVIDILPENAAKFRVLFPDEKFYCPPTEILNPEVTNRGQFNLIHHETGIKIDIIIRKNTDHSRAEFARRQKVPFWDGNEAYLVSPEDLIIKKLSFYREGGSEKHLRDIRGVMSESDIDGEYLQHWIQELRLTPEWEKL